MTHIDAAILGLVQGLTEFLPVSSSGHLVLAQHMLGLTCAENLTMDLLLHVATLAAVLISFRADIIRLVVGITSDAGQRRLALLLLAAMVPTGIIGLSIKPFIAGAFDRPAVVGALLVATGVLLYVAPRLRRPTGSLSDLRLPQALWIGLAQGVAVLPGVSRSGTTICAGMLGGLTGEAAARFSFLLAVLAIGAAMVLNIPDAAALAAPGTGPTQLADASGPRDNRRRRRIGGDGGLHGLDRLVSVVRLLTGTTRWPRTLCSLFW